MRFDLHIRYAIHATLLGVILSNGGAIGVAPAALAQATTAKQDSTSVASQQAASQQVASQQVDWVALPAIPTWTMRVQAAFAQSDSIARRDAFVALIRDALQGPGVVVHVAGTAWPGEAHPDDYAPAPAINFDVNLNHKMSRRLTESTTQRPLKNNAGYYFSYQGTPYVILGPLTIKEQDPDFIRMYVDHELFHVHHHASDSRRFADRELEAWTYQFREWFYKVRRYRQRWDPLIQYYEDASDEAQRRALEQLVEYAQHPPPQRVPPAQANDARREFMAWLERREHDARTQNAKLVLALRKALPASAISPVGGS